MVDRRGQRSWASRRWRRTKRHILYTVYARWSSSQGQNATVLGSVMSPQFPGLWQINVIVPPNTAPSSAVGANSLVV